MLQGLTKSVFPEQAESFSVVSNGAECIMISKKFFLEKANEATMLHLRQVVRTRTRRVVLSLSVSTLIIVVNYRDFFIYIFSVPLLSVLRGHSDVFIPDTMANDLRLRRIFYPRLHPLHFFLS
mgnify:CR=1 FL=1